MRDSQGISLLRSRAISAAKTPLSAAPIHRRRSRLRARSSGLVYVETLVAFPVVLYFALTTLQLVDYAAANLLVKHAAIAAARAAAVIGPDDPQYYGGQARDDLSGGARLTEVRSAVSLALQAELQFQNAPFSLSIDVPGAPNQMVTANLAVTYQCLVPFVNSVCALSSSRTITAIATFPYQPSGN
jgi:hypothetical protein